MERKSRNLTLPSIRLYTRSHSESSVQIDLVESSDAIAVRDRALGHARPIRSNTNPSEESLQAEDRMPSTSTEPSPPLSETEEISAPQLNFVEEASNVAWGVNRRLRPILKRGFTREDMGEAEDSEPSTVFELSSFEDSLLSNRSEVYKDPQTLVNLHMPQEHEDPELVYEASNVPNVHQFPPMPMMERRASTRNPCGLPSYFDCFILGEFIGKGSFANVYKGLNKSARSVVAIKSYRSEFTGPIYYPRVATEIIFVKILRHAHIIPYVFADIKKEFSYLSMEYSAFGNLSVLMKRRTGMSEEVVQNLMKQLFSALFYLHSMSIVHGDIKPQNIIVVKAETFITIKLTDFGLAEVSLADKTFRGRPGTFTYMAPEILLGFPSDYRSDLYSAAVLMFELLFGMKPISTTIRRDNYIKVLKRRKEIVFPQPQVNSLTHYCIDLVKNLLSYDKQDRLSGLALVRHPFLQIRPENDLRDHFFEAYQCFIRASGLVRQNDYGQAYIEVKTAILHLEIHSTRTRDEGVRKYMYKKITKYQIYCQKLEMALSGQPIDPIVMSTETEKLRCLLQPSPTIQSAFDLCTIGEMFFWDKQSKHGIDLLRKGFVILTSIIRHEPNNFRKGMLVLKIDQWAKILSKVEARVGYVGNIGNLTEI